MDLDLFRAALTYEPKTGKLIWNDGWRFAFCEAGHLTPKGYRCVTVAGNRAMAHRVAWALHYGEWPAGLIDHINGNPADNRISNLRQCTAAENAQNTRKRSKTSTRLRGVTFHLQTGRFQARIVKGGKCHWLGYFDTREAAHEAYLAAKSKLHEFAPSPR